MCFSLRLIIFKIIGSSPIFSKFGEFFRILNFFKKLKNFRKINFFLLHDKNFENCKHFSVLTLILHLASTRWNFGAKLGKTAKVASFSGLGVFSAD